METQETIFCCNNKEECQKKNNCLGIIFVILLTVFTFVIGILVGAALSLIVLLALPAIIVLSIILGLLLILTIILMVCNNKKQRKNKCKCYC